jgi:hypothetical protein
VQAGATCIQLPIFMFSHYKINVFFTCRTPAPAHEQTPEERTENGSQKVLSFFQSFFHVEFPSPTNLVKNLSY